MPRRVPVILDLDARGYITSAVKATEATKAMDAQMGALDREVDKVDRDMAELAATTEAAKHQVDDLGDEARGTAADLKLLESRIAAARAQARALGLEFARTGDATAMTERRKELSLAAQLERLRKEVERADGGGGGLGVTLGSAAGTRAGQGFASGFGDALKGMPVKGPLIGALVGAAILAAPTVGAILGGAVAGAAGTGAMAIGILSAAKDPKVQAAAKDFGGSISAEFFSGGQVFVQPVLDSLDILRAAFADLHLGDALAKAAPTVTVIAEGFAKAAKAFMPGFDKFLDRIGPLAGTAARGIEDMGEAFGEFLDDVSASKGTVEGIETLFNLINGTIRGVGNTLSWLGDRYHEFNFIQADVYGRLEDIAGALGLDDLASAASNLNDIFERQTGSGEVLRGTFRRLGPEAIDPFTGYLKHATDQMERLGAETEATRGGLLDYWGTLRGIADANIAWEQAVDDLTESVKENGRTLDITTEKGRNNVQAVYAGIDAAKRQYETGKITAAQYDQQIQKLIEIGVKAGLSRKELEKLAGTYTVTIIVNALVPAVQGAIALVSKAMQNVFSGGGGGAPYTGRGDFRAAGGPVVAGVPYTINERGYETVTFPASGTVHPASLTPQPWSGGATGSQRNELTLRIIHETQDGRVTRRELITDALNRGVPQTTVSASYP